MSRIPEDIAEYNERHRNLKSIAWAIKYYNDNYIYTEWEKPSGKYIKKGTDRRKGFRRRNGLLYEQLVISNEQLEINEDEAEEYTTAFSSPFIKGESSATAKETV
jgi:hypothetical protein